MRSHPIHEPSSKSRCINGSIARRLSRICCGLRRFTWRKHHAYVQSHFLLLLPYPIWTRPFAVDTHFCVRVTFVDWRGSELNRPENVESGQRNEFESNSSGVKGSDSEVTHLSVEKNNKAPVWIQMRFLEHVCYRCFVKTVVKIHSVSAKN
jgi:hypothetical protein